MKRGTGIKLRELIEQTGVSLGMDLGTLERKLFGSARGRLSGAVGGAAVTPSMVSGCFWVSGAWRDENQAKEWIVEYLRYLLGPTCDSMLAASGIIEGRVTPPSGLTEVGAKKGKRGIRLASVVEFLYTGPKTATQVSKHLGSLDRKAGQRALDEAIAEGLVASTLDRNARIMTTNGSYKGRLRTFYLTPAGVKSASGMKPSASPS